MTKDLNKLREFFGNPAKKEYLDAYIKYWRQHVESEEYLGFTYRPQ